MTTAGLPETWKRAMDRATESKLQAIKLDDAHYIVKSRKYAPGAYHMVSLDAAGRICDCSNCPGWTHGGRQRPCYHAGAVAKRLMRELKPQKQQTLGAAA